MADSKLAVDLLAPHDVAKHFVKLAKCSKPLDRDDARVIARSAEIAKIVCRAAADRIVVKADGEPIMQSSSAAATPIKDSASQTASLLAAATSAAEGRLLMNFCARTPLGDL